MQWSSRPKLSVVYEIRSRNFLYLVTSSYPNSNYSFCSVNRWSHWLGVLPVPEHAERHSKSPNRSSLIQLMDHSSDSLEAYGPSVPWTFRKPDPFSPVRSVSRPLPVPSEQPTGGGGRCRLLDPPLGQGSSEQPDGGPCPKSAGYVVVEPADHRSVQWRKDSRLLVDIEGRLLGQRHHRWTWFSCHLKYLWNKTNMLWCSRFFNESEFWELGEYGQAEIRANRRVVPSPIFTAQSNFLYIFYRLLPTWKAELLGHTRVGARRSGSSCSAER